MRSFAVLLTLAAAVPSAAQQTQADSARVYELHEVEVLPRPQNVPDFTAALQQGYPAHLRQAGVGGIVQVAFVVGPDGQPGNVRVVSTPDSSFNAPSAQAVSLLRFIPAQVQGQPVAVRVEQPITWRIETTPAAETPSSEVPDSLVVYAAEDADGWPIPQNYSDFQAALRELQPRDMGAGPSSGEVVVRFVIDPNGQPQYGQVMRSFDERFNVISLQAVRRLRFRPAQRNGAPVWVWMEVPVQWGQPEPAPAASADSASGYELSDVDELPFLLNRDEFGRALGLSYPPGLRDAGREALVQVRFRIEPDGTTSNPVVTHSSDREFDAPTLRAVRMMRFFPARLNGRLVPVWAEQPIQWTVFKEPEQPMFSVPDRPMFGTPARARPPARP